MTPRSLLGGVLAALAGAVLALLIVTAGDGSDPEPVSRLTRMEQSGEAHDMLERHRTMLEEMQQNVSPEMQRIMNEDPMWQMLRSGEWARLDEQHRADLERMLGKAPR